MDMEKIGKAIINARKKAGLSQQELAEKTGVSPQAVSKWEADRAVPDVNNCIAMSRTLGVSLARLLDLEEEAASAPARRRFSVWPRRAGSGRMPRMNILVTIGLAIFPALFAAMLQPKNENELTPLDENAIRAIEKENLTVKKRPENATVGDYLNYSPIIALALVAMGFTYIVSAFMKKGLTALDFNLLNAIFLFTGILLYGNIANYVAAVKDNAPNAPVEKAE